MPTGIEPLNVQATVAADPRSSTFPLKLFGGDGLTFRDVFDLVNPLHHIPLLGTLYRRITGDIIDPAIRVAGGALFGGPIGAGFAAVSVAVKHAMDARNPAIQDVPQIAQAPTSSRGGWIVAASRALGPPAVSPNAVHERVMRAADVSERRGGWIVQAAYAMADARTRLASLESSDRRIDTTA